MRNLVILFIAAQVMALFMWFVLRYTGTTFTYRLASFVMWAAVGAAIASWLRMLWLGVYAV